MKTFRGGKRLPRVGGEPPREVVFGQHNVAGTLIGIGLWAVAGCGIAFDWLGRWRYAL